MRARVLLSVVIALSAPALGMEAFAQTAVPRTILTIHVGSESFYANPILDAGIREALASAPDASAIEYFTEYLESDIFPSDDATQAFSDYIRRKYRGHKIDVVLAMTTTGLQFALDHRAELFPEAPIVFFGLTAPAESERRSGAGVTGITVGVAYAETARLALQLHPTTERLFVVANSSNRVTEEAAHDALRDVLRRVNVTFLEEEPLPRLLAAVKAVPRGSLILYIWQSQNDPADIIYPDAIGRMVAETARVPVYGSNDLHLGTGIVGGVMRRTRDTGFRMGQMALQILSGTRAQDIPIESATVSPIVDWRQIRRWNIDPARLPAGTQILFRELTAWQKYKTYIIVGVTLLVAQAVLIAGLLFQRRRRRIAEQALRGGEAALRSSYDRVRDLASKLLSAQEEERSRIARELHDDINQQLAVLNVELTLVDRSCQGDAKRLAAQALKRVERIGNSVRDLSHGLHPPRLLLVGLVPALEGLQSELAQPGLSLLFTHHNVPSTLPPDVTVSLFRIAQEALQNALKYSRARTITVDLRLAGEALSLTVADDGVGFDVDAVLGKGIGLTTVGERVDAIGGTLRIRSAPGSGTRIEVNVPVPLADTKETIPGSVT